MNQKTILAPETIPLVDIDFMNNTHLDELKMVNDLGKVVTDYQGDKDTSEDNFNEISMLLNAWLEHTIPHFERENKLMQETGFPAFAVHADEHKIALDRFKTVINAWTDNKDIDQVTDFIFNFWPNWFTAHVNSMDMMTAKFAVMNGFDPQATI